MHDVPTTWEVVGALDNDEFLVIDFVVKFVNQGDVVELQDLIGLFSKSLVVVDQIGHYVEILLLEQDQDDLAEPEVQYIDQSSHDDEHARHD